MCETSGSCNQKRLHHEVSAHAPLLLARAWGSWLPVGEGSQGIDLCVLASQRQRVCMLKKTFPGDRQRRGVKGLFWRSPGKPTWASQFDRRGKMYLFVMWRRRAARPRPHPLSSKQTVISPAPCPFLQWPRGQQRSQQSWAGITIKSAAPVYKSEVSCRIKRLCIGAFSVTQWGQPFSGYPICKTFLDLRSLFVVMSSPCCCFTC